VELNRAISESAKKHEALARELLEPLKSGGTHEWLLNRTIVRPLEPEEMLFVLGILASITDRAWRLEP